MYSLLRYSDSVDSGNLIQASFVYGLQHGQFGFDQCLFQWRFFYYTSTVLHAVEWKIISFKLRCVSFTNLYALEEDYMCHNGVHRTFQTFLTYIKQGEDNEQ